MRGINHLVLAGHDLDQLCSLYGKLGFTLTARGRHPFGTGNTVIQLHGCYLELLAVTRPADIVEHRSGQFSFSAFNRDYLARHEGFSMLVMDSKDARADILEWSATGLQTYEPLDFSRTARMPNGQDVTVGFSLALVTLPSAPWLGIFACQHYRPEYYAQEQFLSHPNGAYGVEDVWIVTTDIAPLESCFMTLVSGQPTAGSMGESIFPTPSGRIVLASPDMFEVAFGCTSPHLADGPHLAGLTVGCKLDALPTPLLHRHGNRLVVPPDKGFGTAIAFAAAERH